MNLSIIAPTLSEALSELKKLVKKSENSGRRTIIFCEDRLTLVAERAVCAAVGGTFGTSVYTFARFLASERGADGRILSSQGSAIAIRGITEKNRDKLRLFRRFSAAAAAQSLYDTIAVLYSSGVSADDIASVKADSSLLSDKLHDIALIYAEYNEFLKNSGRLDRNMYLRLLPEVIVSSPKIKGADVIFLGFQAFTGTVSECVKACMRAADNCSGIFAGGPQDIYANEASAQFEAFSSQYGGCRIVTVNSSLTAEAERIRNNLFDPGCFSGEGEPTGRVHIFEAADDGQEMEFIAASIKKFVLDEGVRYASVSVMVADVNGARPTLARTFAQYNIPYYVDERRSLSEHALSALVCDFLECAAGGCAADDVIKTASNFLFGLTEKERDIFRNYVLRCASYRGGVKREPRADICEALGFGYKEVCAARERFLGAFSLLPATFASAEKWADSLKRIIEFFGCEKILSELSESTKDEFPSQSQFNARACKGVISVIEETAELGMGSSYTAREYKKLLQSGFAAAEISLIPPKSDAVFVGDISSTVNVGSDVVFAASLTDAVPPAGADTALLTDREISSLEKLNVKISPKIAQVNRRRRETVALNLCAFKKHLYLSYPVLSGGEEKVRSEIIDYILRLFKNSRGGNLAVLTQKALDISGRGVPYFCSERTPALKMLACGKLDPRVNSALYRVLEENGLEKEAEGVLEREAGKQPIKSGRTLYVGTGGSISPTLLETYFSCPYLNFARQGLKLSERQEGTARPLDTGNFIHAVLQELACVVNSFESEDEARKSGGDIARLKLSEPEYSSIGESAGGKFTAARLIAEAEKISAGVYRQLADSNFHVRDAENWYYIPLGNGLRAGGKVDRVDECGDFVRVIDYKTGGYSADPEKYYAGVKLQLPLYLLAASSGKRPAGAYYFPANIEYKDSDDGIFTLCGFMDADEEVVKNSDITVAPKQRSRYVEAYLGGRLLKGNMTQEDFRDFLVYSSLIARRGAREMFEGNITPSPYVGVCAYCKMGGMCGFAAGIDSDGREVNGISCADIARVVRKQRGDD